MTTVVQHQHHGHHRSQLLAAGVALLAVLAAGALLEITHDDAPTTTKGPETPALSLSPHHLHGSGSMEGQWNHAGTTSGGRVQLGY